MTTTAIVNRNRKRGKKEEEHDGNEPLSEIYTLEWTVDTKQTHTHHAFDRL